MRRAGTLVPQPLTRAPEGGRHRIPGGPMVPERVELPHTPYPPGRINSPAMQLLATILASAAGLLQAQDAAGHLQHDAETLLSDVRQLTTGEQFAAAGEAYFSPD